MSINPPNLSRLLHWTVDDVSFWMNTFNCRKYIKAFKEIGIDGKEIYNMDEEKLAAMNIQQDEIRIIMHEIGKLKKYVNQKEADEILNFQNLNLNINKENNLNSMNSLNSGKLSNDQMRMEQNNILKGENNPGEFTFHVKDNEKNVENINIDINPFTVETQKLVPNFGKKGPKLNNFVDMEQPNQNTNFSLIALKELAINSTKEYIIKKEGETIGSMKEQCSILIPNNGVSRKHCYISYSNGIPYLKDLGSINGTFVKVSNDIKLYKGLILRMGFTDITVTDVQDNSCTIVTNWNEIRKSWLLNIYPTTIGRGENQTISIPCDTKMGVHHARIWWDDGSFFLEDEGSENKTWIRLSPEKTPSNAYKLKFEDEIIIGENIFIIKIVTAPYQVEINGKTTFHGTEVNFYKPEGFLNKEDASTNYYKNQQKAFSKLCIICKKNEKNCQLRPCGDNEYCYSCALSISICTICKRKIMEVNKYS